MRKEIRKLVIVIVIIAVASSVFDFFIVFHFKNLANNEIGKARIESEQRLVEKGANKLVGNKGGGVSPKTIARLKKTGVARYFLSNVKLINNHYVPVVHLCLFVNGKPIYPSYVYGYWSLLNYPNDLSPKIVLVKYLLLPEDSANFHLNSNCYIKEIKTDKDWKEVQEKYGFSKDRF